MWRCILGSYYYGGSCFCWYLHKSLFLIRKCNCVFMGSNIRSGPNFMLHSFLSWIFLAWINIMHKKFVFNNSCSLLRFINSYKFFKKILTRLTWIFQTFLWKKSLCVSPKILDFSEKQSCELLVYCFLLTLFVEQQCAKCRVLASEFILVSSLPPLFPSQNAQNLLALNSKSI